MHARKIRRERERERDRDKQKKKHFLPSAVDQYILQSFLIMQNNNGKKTTYIYQQISKLGQVVRYDININCFSLCL